MQNKSYYYFRDEKKLDSYLTNRRDHDIIHNVNKRRAEVEMAYEHGYLNTLIKEKYNGREQI